MKRSALGAALVLVPVLLVSGCGGDDKSSVTPSPTESASADPAAGLVALDADGFSVKLPHAAASTEQTFTTAGGPVKATVYSDVNDEGGFIVALAPYPNGASVELDKAAQSVAANFGGTIAVNDTIQIEGNDARQVRIDGGQAGGGPITIYLLVVDVHDQLFQLQYVLKGAAPAAAPEILNTVAGTVTFS